MFREDSKIKNICEKIKRKEKLNKVEMQDLIYVFNQGGFDDYEVSSMKILFFSFKHHDKYLEDFPIKLKNIKYTNRVLGVTTYYED